MKNYGKQHFFAYSRARANAIANQRKQRKEQDGTAALGTMEALKNAFVSQESNKEPNGQSDEGTPINNQSNS